MSNVLGSIFNRKTKQNEVRSLIVPPRSGQEGRVIGLSAGSTGNSLTHQAIEFCDALSVLNLKLLLIDINTPSWYEDLVAQLNEGDVSFAFSFAGMCASLSTPGGKGNLWAEFNVPFIRFQLDTPAYFPDRHVSEHHGDANLYWFKEHLDFQNEYVASRGVKACLRPWVMNPMPTGSVVDVKEKAKGPIIFLKNGNDPKGLKAWWQDALPKPVSTILLRCAEEAESMIDSANTLTFARSAIHEAMVLGIDIENSRRLLFMIVAQLDDYLRRVKSRMLAEALSVYPIELWGHNWESFDTRGKKMRFMGGCEYGKTTALMDRAMAVIDMSPNTQYNPHDRILKCIGRSTLFVSNRQAFMDEWEITDLAKPYVFSIESIRQRVDEALENPIRTVERGLELAQKCKSYIDPLEMPHQISALRQLAQFNQGGRPEGLQNFINWPHQLF
jgi:hypothetical protein